MKRERHTYLTLQTVEAARQGWLDRISAEGRELPTERVPLSAALHRVLAEPVAARRSSPAFHGAAMDGITVNAILPGRIDTEMLAYATPERRAQWLQSTPLGRFGDTADIAELAVFLASDKGGYIKGAKINVNGGLSTG